MTGTHNTRTGLRAVIAIVVLAAALVLPAQAFASSNDCSNVGSDPTAAQYCSPSNIQTAGNSGNTSGTPSGTSAVAIPSTESVSSSSGGGSLPFTGLDVLALLAVAAVLTGTGLALRRLTVSGGQRRG